MPESKEIHELVDHLFRHESGKMISTLTKVFGTENLELAEDVVQDSIIEAMKKWSYVGIPDNPTAWLYRVAKNKTLNVLKRRSLKTKYISTQIFHDHLESEDIFNEDNFLDDQLKMMFICCHPSISSDSQIALILRTLCGFNSQEIANAFLTTSSNIEKRLVRARQTIRDRGLSFDLPEDTYWYQRLDRVLEAIYLLFNEGYSPNFGAEVIRFEICEEAIRLVHILILHPKAQNYSDAHALLSVMYLNSCRFTARISTEGTMLSLKLQDRSKWDRSMMKQGFDHLKIAVMESSMSIYHYMATISAYHCASPSYQETNWKGILDIYDRLLILSPSPVVMLNRAIAIYLNHGASPALKELESIQDHPALNSYVHFYLTRAELESDIGRDEMALISLKHALRLSQSDIENNAIQEKIEKSQKKLSNSCPD